MNFGNRIKYIISLPMSIILWFLSSGFVGLSSISLQVTRLTGKKLIGDLAAMNSHAKPDFPSQIWSGGFWYALAAAVLYVILMLALMANLVGYIRGHYPQHFELTEDQRTLIIQTMIYFIWVAGGAAVYSKIESWHFLDAVC